MRWAEFVNENEVRKAISVLQEPGGIFEVRIIGTAKKDILSGYFKDADTLFKAFNSIRLHERNVYITLGRVKDECFSRIQREKFVQTTQTTSDTDVQGYRWLFIDLDPVRATGISSSDEELRNAEALARKVYAYLKDLGFEEPVKALSGNGCHLLYKSRIVIDVFAQEFSGSLCIKAMLPLVEAELPEHAFMQHIVKIRKMLCQVRAVRREAVVPADLFHEGVYVSGLQDPPYAGHKGAGVGAVVV